MSRCTEDCKRPTPFQAHCSNEETLLFQLTRRDGDTFPVTSFDTEFLNGSPDTCRVLVEKFAYLRSTQPGLVKSGSLRYPRGTVDGVVLPRRDKSEVLFTVVSPVSVTVVNVLLSGDITRDDSVFVGLDVTADPDLPSEADVAMTRDIPPRRIVRYHLTGAKLTDASAITTLTAGSTAPLLSGPSDLGSAVGTRLPHGAILQVKTLCHRHFGGVYAFDKHRVNGHCLDPGMFEYVERDGVWRRPVDHEEVQAFKDRVRGTR